MILKNMFELYNIFIIQRFMNFNLSDKLNSYIITFCLARDRFNEFLAIIFAANIFLF